MNEYQIFNEDCLKGMKPLEAGSIDMILTDLPYNFFEYERRNKPLPLDEIWKDFQRLLKPTRAVALFSSGKFTMKLAASNVDWYKYKWVWIKNRTFEFLNAKNRPLSKYEEILIFSDGMIAHADKSKNRMIYYPQGLKTCNKIKGPPGPCIGNPNLGLKKYIQSQTNYPKDVLYFDIPASANRVHPNQKPVDLLEYLIKTYTIEGETVLDATMGSGSTGVACMNTGRRFIGFETEKKFFDIAEKRINEALEAKQKAPYCAELF